MDRWPQIRRRLLLWYRSNARDLPWRRTRDPYRILLSEVMLQQTQVSRVLAIYPKFLRRFPTFRALAKASASAVIVAWRGMGYNRRALYLRQCAAEVIHRYGGRLPDDPEELRRLPGIGRYTAHAVVCFAFGRPAPVVDTNVRRALGRLAGRSFDENAMWKFAERVLPQRSAYAWNQALMELGSTICTAANPRCGVCPVRAHCPSAHRAPRSFKVKQKEPSRRGTPDRIHRGKIVEVLRDVRTPVTVSQVGRAAIPGYCPADRRWLEGIVGRLERDGLVRIVRGKIVLGG